MRKGKTLKRGGKSQASASQGQNPQRKPPHQHLDLGLPASRLRQCVADVEAAGSVVLGARPVGLTLGPDPHGELLPTRMCTAEASVVLLNPVSQHLIHI